MIHKLPWHIQNIIYSYYNPYLDMYAKVMSDIRWSVPLCDEYWTVHDDIETGLIRIRFALNISDSTYSLHLNNPLAIGSAEPLRCYVN